MNVHVPSEKKEEEKEEDEDLKKVIKTNKVNRKRIGLSQVLCEI